MIREASKNEILKLKEALKTKDYPSVTIISLLNVETEFDFSRPIYVSKSDPQHFVFIPRIFSGVPSFSIYWDSEKIEKDELKLYLKSIPNWNWNKEFILSFLDTNFGSMFHEMLVGEEISTKLRVSHFEISITYEIVPECLENVTSTLPKGFVFGELQAKHIPFLFEQWKYNYTESVSSYQKIIKIFPTSAVFKAEERDGDPIAWVLFYSHGHIGMISTLPDYRRKGFAVAVLNNLCNKLKHKNIRLITQVNDDNEISRNFHQKIGARMLGKSYWNIYDTI